MTYNEFRLFFLRCLILLIEDSNTPEKKGALNCHVDKLNSEIAEYERLTSHDRHQPILLKLEDIDDFAKILIKARMAAKLTQKELAALSGLTEEQIGRYEDNDYQDASFLDVLSVISDLEIDSK